jgi:hypothetical protein
MEAGEHTIVNARLYLLFYINISIKPEYGKK